MKAFIESQFSYCPMVWYGMVWYGMVWYGMVWYGMVWYGMVWYGMVWMFHSRTLNNKINELHERALRLVYKDHNSTFDQLLLPDKSYSIYDRTLQKLAIEMYKVKHNLYPAFMHNIFPSLDNNYNLRKNRDFKTENIHTTVFWHRDIVISRAENMGYCSKRN